MEKINLGYSLKNIPIPGKESYMKNMLGMIESFLRRIRWKAYWFNQKDTNTAKKETYGFNSENVPPTDDQLSGFENDLYEMANGIQFRRVQNPFLQKLSADTRKINASNEVYVPADKTTNLYKVPPDEYKKLLNDNITANYKKASTTAKTRIDREAKKIAKRLDLEDRIEQYAEKDAFITLKDHKENFENNPKCRLLNPAKSEIGVISSQLLKRINNDLRETLTVRQWKNSSEVLNFFSNIQQRDTRKFVQFDIVEFYPSISERLLSDALNFAKRHVQISSREIEIIQHARKSLLFQDGDVWVKKNGSLFDVTMGSFDGAEVCDLIGLFLLSELKQKFSALDLGLYRDDGLGAYDNLPGPETERLKKKIVQLFSANGLKITIEFNMNRVNFLDATLDMPSGKYWPYRKPNDNPLYINKNSNHPPTITKQLPGMVEQRISSISCDENEFNKVKDVYQKALKDSGFDEDINFKAATPRRRHTRTRKTIWFNPPYNAAVETDIGRKFISIVKKHFHDKHKYYKIFNKNTLKISYSCTPNMKSIIAKHNKKVLSQPSTVDNGNHCNCHRANKDNCPLNGECTKGALVYHADVTARALTRRYLGATEPMWKKRFGNHKSSFANPVRKFETCLSKYIWNLKEQNIPFEIKWALHKQSFPYQCGTRKCDICLSEKLEILRGDPKLLINKRSEIMNKCRHKLKFKLYAVK